MPYGCHVSPSPRAVQVLPHVLFEFAPQHQLMYGCEAGVRVVAVRVCRSHNHGVALFGCHSPCTT